MPERKMFCNKPYILFFTVICAYGSAYPTRDVVDPLFGSIYMPFSDLFYPDREDISYGDGSVSEFNSRLNESSFNLMSGLKVNDSVEATKQNEGMLLTGFRSKAEASNLNNVSTHNILKIDEPSTRAHLNFNLNFSNYEDDNVIINVDDLRQQVSNKPQTVSTTTENPATESFTQDTGFSPYWVFNSLFSMIKGVITDILESLFRPFIFEANSKKDTSCALKEKDPSSTRKVYKRDISDSAPITTAITSIDDLNPYDGDTSSSESQQITEKILQSKTDEAEYGLPDKKGYEGTSPSIAITDKEKEHNSEKNIELTEPTPSHFQSSFITAQLVKKSPPAFLDDDQEMKLMDELNSRILEYPVTQRQSYDIKSSSFGEAVLVTVACVFFIVVFATAGTALAYAVRKKQLVRDPVGSDHAPNLVHA